MTHSKKWINPSHTPTYNSWNSMRSRCYREKDKCFHLYGARGIRICDRWLNNYDAFFEDMGEKPKGMSLDRIDTNGNYEPANCRWVSMREQQNNRRNNVFIEFKNETHTIAEWARKLKILPDTLWKRINLYKISIEKSLCENELESRQVKHGTNNMYSRLKCRCKECTEFNRIKSKRARDSLKLKKGK